MFTAAVISQKNLGNEFPILLLIFLLINIQIHLNRMLTAYVRACIRDLCGIIRITIRNYEDIGPQNSNIIPTASGILWQQVLGVHDQL